MFAGHRHGDLDLMYLTSGSSESRPMSVTPTPGSSSSDDKQPAAQDNDDVTIIGEEKAPATPAKSNEKDPIVIEDNPEDMEVQETKKSGQKTAAEIAKLIYDEDSQASVMEVPPASAASHVSDASDDSVQQPYTCEYIEIDVKKDSSLLSILAELGIFILKLKQGKFSV